MSIDLSTVLIALLAAVVVVCVVVFMQLRQSRLELQQQRLLLDDKSARVDILTQTEMQLRSEVAGLTSTLEQTRLAADEKLKLLSDAKQQLTQEFQLLAQKIFDEKSERLTKQNQSTIEVTLNPLREQLADFRKRVETVYDLENKDRASLRAELGHLKELNQRISDEALNLTRALKGDNKAQGNWGEVVLERVLEESGLRKGHEYETQLAVQTEEGRRRQPDVVVHLPDNKDIVIDAKVSLIAYERYCNAASEAERDAALRAHIASVRAHIEGLSLKQYENLPGVNSLDFVLIFVPIEAAFLAAFENDANVFREAYEKNIIVVSPTTLLATLRTVQTIWRYERQNANADLIARQAGALHDQFARVLEALQDLGKSLDKSRGSYELAMDRFARGKGNLVKRVGDMAKLGAKTKRTLPPELVERSDDAAEWLDAAGGGEPELLADAAANTENSDGD